MAQSTPVSEQALDCAEEVHDLFDRFAADGQLCATEIQIFRSELDELVTSVMKADHCRALSVAILRGGPDCKRARSLASQWMTLEVQQTTEGPVASVAIS